MEDAKKCARCGEPVCVGEETWWQGVKAPEGPFDSSVGDLCNGCHDKWLREGTAVLEKAVAQMPSPATPRTCPSCKASKGGHKLHCPNLQIDLATLGRR